MANLNISPEFGGTPQLVNPADNGFNVPSDMFKGTTMPTSLGVDKTLNTQGTPQNTIMGMSPNSFSAVLGSMGAAIAPKGSWQEKIGLLASGLGKANLQSLAATAQNKGTLENIQTAMKADPQFKQMLMKYFNSGSTPLPATPVTPDSGVQGGQ